MNEKIPKPSKPEQDPIRAQETNSTETGGEKEMQELVKKFDDEIILMQERISRANDHLKAETQAIESLALLQKEMVEEFHDILQRMILQKIEAADLEATNQEMEAEFQKNPHVEINLRSAGLNSLLDSEVDEDEVKEEILYQAFLHLNARAINNRPENIEFRARVDVVSNSFATELTNLTHEADYGKPDEDVQVVATELDRVAKKARTILDNSLKELRELFYNQ